MASPGLEPMPPSSTFNNLPSQKQERILDEALSEFAAKGYAQASVNRLVSPAGHCQGQHLPIFPRQARPVFQQVFDFAVERVKGHLQRGCARDTRGQDVFSRLEHQPFGRSGANRKKPAFVPVLSAQCFLRATCPSGAGCWAPSASSATTTSWICCTDGAAAGELQPGPGPGDGRTGMVDATLERFLIASVMEHMDAGPGPAPGAGAQPAVEFGRPAGGHPAPRIG